MGLGHDDCEDNCGSTACPMPRIAKLDVLGPVAMHDQACAVYQDIKAVYNLNRGVFEPSWYAQAYGWHLVHAETWFQRLVLRLAFSDQISGDA